MCQGPSSLACVEQMTEGHIRTFCPGVAESDSYFRKILLIVLYRMGIKGVRKGSRSVIVTGSLWGGDEEVSQAL